MKKLSGYFNLRALSNTRALTVMALLTAASVAVGLLEAYVSPTQKLYSFAYLPRAMAALAYGPAAALAVAFVSDFVSFLADPRYGYFFGYALSAMVTDLLIALFLYGREIKWGRAAAARLLTLVLVVFGLNGLWQTLFYGSDAAKYFTGFRLLRNLAQFPLDVFLIVKLGRVMRRFASGAWR